MTRWELYTELQKMIDDPNVDSDQEVVFQFQNGRTHGIGDIEDDGYRLLLIEE